MNLPISNDCILFGLTNGIGKIFVEFIFFEEIISYGSCTILCSVTALEGYINEIYVDRTIHFPGYNQQLIDDIWEMTEKDAILDKYSFVLSLKDKGRFNKDLVFYRDTVDLIKLRNALVH